MKTLIRQLLLYLHFIFRFIFNVFLFFSFFLFLFNVPVNNFSVMLRRSHLFLGITSTFGEKMSLAQGNNTPTRARIEPGSPDSESDALTTRPVRSPLFSMLFVKIRCEISETRGTESLFIDMFGHDIQQPSP